mmetsp:Transcript_33308/g.80565  ORF Transcript_33308/g.80565 Transcript_33308/m.80565 type:complete len:323 (+) Transcript_33308:1291-2259(+)
MHTLILMLENHPKVVQHGPWPDIGSLCRRGWQTQSQNVPDPPRLFFHGEKVINCMTPSLPMQRMNRPHGQRPSIRWALAGTCKGNENRHTFSCCGISVSATLVAQAGIVQHTITSVNRSCNIARMVVNQPFFKCRRTLVVRPLLVVRLLLVFGFHFIILRFFLIIFSSIAISISCRFQFSLLFFRPPHIIFIHWSNHIVIHHQTITLVGAWTDASCSHFFGSILQGNGQSEFRDKVIWVCGIRHARITMPILSFRFIQVGNDGQSYQRTAGSQYAINQWSKDFVCCNFFQGSSNGRFHGIRNNMKSILILLDKGSFNFIVGL